MTTIASPPFRERTRRRLLVLLGLAISVGLLYWVLRRTSFHDILTHLRNARPLPLLAAVAIATSTFVIRTVRWRILLRAEDGGPIRWSPLWHATAMGFMANNTLPLRLGELVRSYAASRLGRVPLATALSSVAVERALDLLTLVALLGVALLRAGLPADTVLVGVRLDVVAARAAGVCLVLFAGALFVLLFPGAAEGMIRRLLPWPRLADRLVGLVEQLRIGFGVLRAPSRLFAAVAWSAVHWLVGATSFFVAFSAFGIQVDYTGALLVQSLLAFGVAAPSTPGYFGVFEVVVAAGLGLFGVPTAVALAYGITYHIATFVPIVLLGFWSLTRTGLHVRDATEAKA